MQFSSCVVAEATACGVPCERTGSRYGPGHKDVSSSSLVRAAFAGLEGKLETEASGNINLDSVEAVGRTGVQFISSGALTHSVRALDISLKLKTNAA